MNKIQLLKYFLTMGCFLISSIKTYAATSITIDESNFVDGKYNNTDSFDNVTLRSHSSAASTVYHETITINGNGSDSLIFNNDANINQTITHTTSSDNGWSGWYTKGIITAIKNNSANTSVYNNGQINITTKIGAATGTIASDSNDDHTFIAIDSKGMVYNEGEINIKNELEDYQWVSTGNLDLYGTVIKTTQGVVNNGNINVNSWSNGKAYYTGIEATDAADGVINNGKMTIIVDAIKGSRKNKDYESSVTGIKSTNSGAVENNYLFISSSAGTNLDIIGIDTDNASSIVNKNMISIVGETRNGGNTSNLTAIKAYNGGVVLNDGNILINTNYTEDFSGSVADLGATNKVNNSNLNATGIESNVDVENNGNIKIYGNSKLTNNVYGINTAGNVRTGDGSSISLIMNNTDSQNNNVWGIKSGNIIENKGNVNLEFAGGSSANTGYALLADSNVINYGNLSLVFNGGNTKNTGYAINSINGAVENYGNIDMISNEQNSSENVLYAISANDKVLNEGNIKIDSLGRNKNTVYGIKTDGAIENNGGNTTIYFRGDIGANNLGYGLYAGGSVENNAGVIELQLLGNNSSNTVSAIRSDNGDITNTGTVAIKGATDEDAGINVLLNSATAYGLSGAGNILNDTFGIVKVDVEANKLNISGIEAKSTSDISVVNKGEITVNGRTSGTTSSIAGITFEGNGNITNKGTINVKSAFLNSATASVVNASGIYVKAIDKVIINNEGEINLTSIKPNASNNSSSLYGFYIDGTTADSEVILSSKNLINFDNKNTDANSKNYSIYVKNGKMILNDFALNINEDMSSYYNHTIKKEAGSDVLAGSTNLYAYFNQSDITSGKFAFNTEYNIGDLIDEGSAGVDENVYFTNAITADVDYRAYLSNNYDSGGNFDGTQNIRINYEPEASRPAGPSQGESVAVAKNRLLLNQRLNFNIINQKLSQKTALRDVETMRNEKAKDEAQQAIMGEDVKYKNANAYTNSLYMFSYFNTLKSTLPNSEYSGDGFGTVIGYENTSIDNTLLGVSFGYNKSDVDYNGTYKGDTNEAKIFSGSFYASREFAKNFWMKSFITAYGSKNNYETSFDQLVGDYNTFGAEFLVSANYLFEMGNNYLLPEIEFSYLWQHQPDHTFKSQTEKLSDVRYYKENNHEFYTTASLMWFANFNIGKNVLMPYVNLNYTRTLTDGIYNSLQSIDGSGIVNTTTQRDKDSFGTIVGAQMVLRSNAVIGLNYNGNFSKNTSSHGALVELKINL